MAAKLKDGFSEQTSEGRKELAEAYAQMQPHGIKRLDPERCLLLVGLAQRWSDEDIQAALDGGKD